jgi:hypothetical protein
MKGEMPRLAWKMLLKKLSREKRLIDVSRQIRASRDARNSNGCGGHIGKELNTRGKSERKGD